MTTERATYRKAGRHWQGVIKSGTTVVAACEHLHKNRDQSTHSSGPSAVSCAKKMLSERQGTTIHDEWTGNRL